MARLSTLRSSSLFRRLLGQQIRQQQQPCVLPITSRSSSTLSSLISSDNIVPSLMTPTMSRTSVYIPTVACLFSSFSLGCRSYSSDSDLPSNMVAVKSSDQLNESLQKAIDESSSSVFYFTAVWCGPCRYLWPDIKHLSDTFPDVKFYKVDIDEVQEGQSFRNLHITSVPTLYFFKNGKKVAEVVGADPKKIKDTTSSVYKTVSTEYRR